jgi:Cysteine rich repeat
MSKLLFAMPFVLMASAAFAQQERDACTRDASRFCRPHLNEGDQVVLSCLKQNRSRLTKGCQQVLTSHGQ